MGVYRKRRMGKGAEAVRTVKNISPQPKLGASQGAVLSRRTGL